MLNGRSDQAAWLAIIGALSTVVLLVTPSVVLAQATGTATIRGTVEDTSGGGVPNAAVTLTNTGTNAVATAVTDGRGGYQFIVFPGTYSIKVELTGFKTFQQQGIAIRPADTRGLDVRLEVGPRAETVTVTAITDVIQTETGSREGVLTAAQIENLSVIGRSSLELLRILPGVVAPDASAFESVSFGGGANDTRGYTFNGIRSTNNTVSLDGTALIDIGSNGGVIVTLNNDMVQEVKVQSSNFAAEYGAGGMSISAVTKAGTAEFHGTVYDYIRDYRLAANDRSNSIAGVEKPKSAFQYPGGNIGGPIFWPGFNENRDTLFFFAGLEVQRQKVDPGSTFGVVPTLKQRQGDFSEFLTNNGQNLNQPVGNFIIPPGFPTAGQPAPNNDFSSYMTALGRTLVNLYPEPNYSDGNDRYNYVLSELNPTNRLEMKYRVDWNITTNTKAYVRLAMDSEEVESVRGVWWGASEVALPSPNLGTNKGRSYSGNIVSVLSPTMTSEMLVSWARLTLDNTYKDPALMSLSNYGLPALDAALTDSPYIPGVIPNWGGGVSNMWSAVNDMYAHNDALQVSSKLTKIVGAHSLKFGVAVERLQKQQNFNNNEEGYFVYTPASSTGTTGTAVADILAGRPTQFTQGTPSPDGEFRFWNFDFFVQDSWKLRPNLTLEYGVRGGYWTNNAELNGLGGWFDPTSYDPNSPQFLDPGEFTTLNGVRYVNRGQAPAGILENRPPFAMPRVNVAWNIDGQGNNVLRGGYGLFYNRYQGNLEYDNTLRLPPYVYGFSVDAYQGAGYGGGVGLNYDTLDEATLASRLGAITINTLTPHSFTFPRTHSFSVSYARRIFFDQVAEIAYVGTRGRDLISRIELNAVPQGALSSGTIGAADLSDPVHRWALDDQAVNTFRPYRAYSNITQEDFEGVSDYNSMQITMSRQGGRRLQYFMAYTLSQTKGTLGLERRNRDPFTDALTYGTLDEDRRHLLNVSWNAFLPDLARGALDNPVGRGFLNGWQLSGITTFASGQPLRLTFTGAAGTDDVEVAYYGTPDKVLITQDRTVLTNGIAPVYTCDPRLGGSKHGEKLLDINCIGFPAFGEDGQVLAPYDLRTPHRFNNDLTVFKNFQIRGDQRIQLRVGFFNIFNTSYITFAQSPNDVDLQLNTVCNRTFNDVPNGIGGTVNDVCDATGGFSFTQNTIDNFGKINLRRGHRVIEIAVKYFF